MIDCFLICSTPRTGSTYLCDLLKSCEIAGKPQSYFRKQDLEEYAQKWNLDKNHSFLDYIEKAKSTGTTKNGIFSSRVMWGTMDEITEKLKLYSHPNLSDISLLQERFGNIKFIYLERKDIVSQAVSRLKAEQTNIWHLKEIENKENSFELTYDEDRIKQFINEILEHNKNWISWFDKNNIQPFKITYEEFISNPNDICLNILEYLDVPIESNIRFSTNYIKMADEISQKWIKKYNSENT